MFRPDLPSIFLGCFASLSRGCAVFAILGISLVHSLHGKKVSPSVIIASIEGEVSSLNMVDDFKVQMGPTSVGKKINPKTILTTGKTGKIALLFSNGTLITIKPGSRFYLRTYTQLEGMVEGVVDPGKLEEEPTQSELSAHLDFGDLVVKAPKLKKGSSMKLTSPLGTAGIRGTMFQLMAVRNSVTGDIMGGINLISGDIDFTDTGGNSVSLLSGQSIQLATSKLGEPVASKTGELVDLSSTYGPALRDGFVPPTPELIFPEITQSSSKDGGSDLAEDLFNQPTQVTFNSSVSNFEFIHQLATDLFFEIEAAEMSSADFSFEDMAIAPTVDIPTPEPEAPVAPPSVTGETIAGADLEFFQGGHPELQLLGKNNTTDPLVKIFDNGIRMQVEMRAPSEGVTWRKIDPWVKAVDFLGNDITSGVQISGTPTILLPNKNTAESDAPSNGGKVSYEVSYTIRDLRGLSTAIFRQVDVVATRPTIQISNTSPSFPWNELDLDNDGTPFDSFYKWIIEHVTVTDVRGENLPYDAEALKLGTFSLSGSYDLSAIGTYNSIRVVAVDWRGLRTESVPFTIQITSPENLPVLSTSPFQSNFGTIEGNQSILEYGDPLAELEDWLDSGSAVDSQGEPVAVTTRIFGNDILSPSAISDIWPGSGIDYTIVFEITDPRWVAGGSDPQMKELKEQLTVSETHPIRVVSTPPKLELIFHNPRDGLGVSENFDEISYLVRSKENVSEFPDDGAFSINPVETNRQDRKLYYKATAYNGYGDDITNLVVVQGADQVDDTTLNEATTLTISVDDKTIRGLTQGAVSTLTPKVKIIDVLAPKISLPSDQSTPFIVQGIMPEITLLSGALRDQVSGNAREDYYFNDPGIEIIDNYYTEAEIYNHNEIETKSYTFRYTNLSDASDTSGDVTYNSVFEYGQSSIQTDLDMARLGDYSLTYSISDPPGNAATLTRTIKVEDNIPPVVKLYGQQTMYVDLKSIFEGESRYYDPGAYAIEDLYKEGKGFFDWDTEDDALSWSYEIQVCNNLEFNLYDDAINVDRDFIGNTILGLADNPPSQVLRYKFHYILKDRAGNEGRATRTIELRGSPNLYPTIFFLLSHSDALDGIPSDDFIDETSNTATLPSLTWEIEVGKDQYTNAPGARVFTDLGGGQQENLNTNFTIQMLHLKSGDILDTNQTILPEQDLSSFFSSVNYWNHEGVEYFVSGSVGSYSKYPSSDATNWRRVVLRYSVENSLGNKSVRDIEVRLMDTTAPTVTKNTFSGSTIEVGVPFDDPGVVITDLAGSLISSENTIDLIHPQGGDDNDTFEELSIRGFWTVGDFTITYKAFDEFGNHADEQVLNLSVQDTKDPHVAVISHDILRQINSSNSYSSLDYTGGNNPSVSPENIFRDSDVRASHLINLSPHYNTTDYKFFSETPYVREDGTGNFLLKASELKDTFLSTLVSNPSSLASQTQPTVDLTNSFGRSYAWHSPFKIEFNSTSLNDPGFLVYEPSDSGLDYSVSVNPVFADSNNSELPNQIASISLSIIVKEKDNAALRTEINPYRTYTFLDDFKPLISISPLTDLDSQRFIMIEAGYDFDDEYESGSNGSDFKILQGGEIVDEKSLSVTAYDVSDGYITDNIRRTILDLNDSGETLNTTYSNVNHVYQIRYDVDDYATDPGPNSADPVYRYLIVKDNTAPLIYPQATDANFTDNFELDYTSDSPDVDDENEVEDYLLQGLVASDYGAKGAGNGQVIDPNLDWSVSAYRDKWTVKITKPDGGPFEPGKVFPFVKIDPGYDVNVTVTDEFGNTSEPRFRKLKIGDYKKPIITLLGSSEIHDFLRFSTNTGFDDNSSGPNNQEHFFVDQEDSLEFNSSGFSGGAHRIILDNYTFVDPGAYAEDDNSYFPSPAYKDLDGDGIGETYAVRRVSNRNYMVACDDQDGTNVDIGVIFAYSVLEKVEDPVLYFQNLLADNTFGLDTSSLTDVNASFPPEDENNTLALSEVKVPDVNGSGYDFDTPDKTNRVNMDVMKITIEYRVRDGWDNFSDIKQRLVYIYESRQFPNFAFYATPLTDGDGTEFEHYYDDGTGRPYLNDSRKDSDGDGVSDFWEKVFGSNPLDRSDVPEEDLSNPTVFNNIDFNTTISP